MPIDDGDNVEKKEEKKEKKEKKLPIWVTPMFGGMVFFIILTFVMLIIAWTKVGCGFSSPCECSGEMWYDCLFGGC